MADDLREREPLRDQADDPPEDGTRSDVAPSSGGSAPVAAGGEAIDRAESIARPADGSSPAGDPAADVKHPTRDE